jgi:hypothetical protein
MLEQTALSLGKWMLEGGVGQALGFSAASAFQ